MGPGNGRLDFLIVLFLSGTAVDFLSYEVGAVIAPEGLSELVHRAQAGDRQAEDELLRRIQPALDRFARQFGDFSTGVESVHDLSQDASLRLWDRLNQFRGTADDHATAAMLYDWLRQLVRSVAANRREARDAAKRRPVLPILHLAQSGAASRSSAGVHDPVAVGPGPASVAAAGEADDRIRVALQKISDATDREILELCFMQGLSLRTVSERLNLNYEKVRERYHAALRFLERELEGLL